MSKASTSRQEVVHLRRDIRRLLEQRLLEAVELVLEEELGEALGSRPYERTAVRRGYRNGTKLRRVTTVAGTRELRVPRGRVATPEGETKEFTSQLVPRYARRVREVDEAILACYLAGANSRRIQKALAPLLGEEHLSKSAASRVVGRLKERFAAWRERDCAGERYALLFLDGFHVKVRLARRVVAVPMLAALGVRPNGQKVLVALRLATSEAARLWAELLEDLQRRGLAAPELLIVDGHAGLRKALAAWPGVRVQRCTQHKLRNLLEHCPRHAHPELRRDWTTILDARDGLAAHQAYAAFLAKWSRLCPAVARSLEEAGEELLTFYEFPRSMWKTLRSTNALENLHREFRRRTKTQASFATEEAALTLLWAMVACGQIRLRSVNGHQDLQRFIATTWTQAA
jgi:putative transposase